MTFYYLRSRRHNKTLKVIRIPSVKIFLGLINLDLSVVMVTEILRLLFCLVVDLDKDKLAFNYSSVHYRVWVAMVDKMMKVVSYVKADSRNFTP